MNNFEWTILGLLADAPHTGYDLLRVFRTSPVVPWRSSSGSVYPALKRLVSLQLATSTEEATQGGRSTVTYTITPAGRDRLQEWLGSPLEPTFPEATTEMLIRLLFEHMAPPGVLEHVLREYRALLITALKPAEETLAQCNGCLPVHQKYCLLNGIVSLQAQLRWADTLLGEMQKP